MSQKFENKYEKLKNYELESIFDLSKQQKQQLANSISPRERHNFKLQEFYLKVKSTDFAILEQEVLEYIVEHDYLLEREQIGKFYEVLAFAATNPADKDKYIEQTIEIAPTLYCIKIAIYQALLSKNIYLAARLMLIAIEADIDFDIQLAYYNLVVENFFEEDINEYYKLMEAFQDKYITVDNLTIEFSFNKLIANYYIQKNSTETENREILEAKKSINVQLLKVISSMKNEDQLRDVVLNVRVALNEIDTNPKVDIFSLMSFNLIPKPKGIPVSSPFNRIK